MSEFLALSLQDTFSSGPGPSFFLWCFESGSQVTGLPFSPGFILNISLKVDCGLYFPLLPVGPNITASHCHTQ